jgi:predicted MFS family arabinose efflux permease
MRFAAALRGGRFRFAAPRHLAATSGDAYLATMSTAGDERRALAVLLGVIFLNIAGFGLVIPLLPFFGQSFQADAWQITLLFSAYSFGSFLGEPFWGRLSDRIGRRRVLIVTITCAALSYIGLAFAPTIWAAMGMRLIGGFFFGNISTLQGAIADITAPEKRAARMGVMGAAFSAGFVAGPALGGLLARPSLGTLGFQLPLFAAAGFGLASALAVVALVRDVPRPVASGPKPARTARLREALAHPVIGRVILISFLVVSGFAGIEATWGLWTEQEFGWGPREIGFAFMGIGVLGAFCQAWLSGRLVRRWGEVAVLTAGLVFMAVGMLTQFVAAAWPIVILGFSFVCLGQSICFPNIAALISKSAPPDRQGEMLGLNMSGMALARIGGPVVAGQAFSLVSPGAPFLITAALTLPAMWLASQVGRRAAA